MHLMQLANKQFLAGSCLCGEECSRLAFIFVTDLQSSCFSVASFLLNGIRSGPMILTSL